MIRLSGCPDSEQGINGQIKRALAEEFDGHTATSFKSLPNTEDRDHPIQRETAKLGIADSGEFRM
jgi:hypothetical protein